MRFQISYTINHAHQTNTVNMRATSIEAALANAHAWFHERTFNGEAIYDFRITQIIELLA